jgi:acyl-coenzyme A thioesterase 13
MRWLNPVVLSAQEGRMVFEYTVRHEMTNSLGILHGGVTAAIMDDVIAATIVSCEESSFYVTLSNVIDYFSPAAAGDKIQAETTIIKKGKQIVNIQCEIWDRINNRLTARGYSNLIRTEIKKTNI